MLGWTGNRHHVTRQAPYPFEEGLAAQPGVGLLGVSGEREHDVVTALKQRWSVAHQSDAVGQAGRPIEEHGQPRRRIDVEPDVGQAPDCEHGKIQVPAQPDMVQKLQHVASQAGPPAVICRGRSAGYVY